MAFKHREKVKENIATILRERSRIEDRLSRFKYVLEVHPSDANFILVKVEEPKMLYDFLVEKGIIVRDRSKVTLCEGCLRFTIGQPQENKFLIDALKEWETLYS